MYIPLLKPKLSLGTLQGLTPQQATVANRNSPLPGRNIEQNQAQTIMGVEFNHKGGKQGQEQTSPNQMKTENMNRTKLEKREHCGLQETIENILIHCPKYQVKKFTHKKHKRI